MFSYATVAYNGEGLMNSSIRFCISRIAKLFQKWPGKNQGAALVIALLVVMSLVLLGLSILLQSNTEHMIAVNERDATSAMFDAEAALQLAKGVLSASSDINSLFLGPDGASLSPDDGIMQIKDYQSS